MLPWLVGALLGKWLGVKNSAPIGFLGVAFEPIRHTKRWMPFPVYLGFVWLLAGVLAWTGGWKPIVKNEELNNFLEDPLVHDFTSSPHSPSFFEPILDENFQHKLWEEEFPENSTSSAKTASVIFAAHGEHKYIQRTIASIYINTAPKILYEIIVVDDASEPPLSDLIFPTFPLVRYKRHSIQQGLIRSKTHGASIAKGDVIVFLDAHVHAEPGWLPPLLRRIGENYKRVVVPLIPILDEESWTVKDKGVGIKMMFNWGLGFNWFDDGNDWVPTMSGGLLSISRKWWWESGEYDTGMRLWGAENIEQSIRIWLCGGEIQVARDSRVSHLFRPLFPYPMNDTQVMINKARTVAVWFDDWKAKVWTGDPNLKHFEPLIGDISERVALKEKLKCGTFSDYVDRFREVFRSRGMFESKPFKIKDTKSDTCVREDNERWIMGDCATSSSFTENDGSLRRGDFCFDADARLIEKINEPILRFHCHTEELGITQKFLLTNDGFIKWENFCAMTTDDKILRFGECNDTHNFIKHLI